MSKVENARITSTFLGIEDHGIMTATITVEGNDWGCNYGGYAFDGYDKKKEKRVGSGFGIDWIAGLLNTLGVDRWEKLEGQLCRCEFSVTGKIARIGHPIKDKWFSSESIKESQS